MDVLRTIPEMFKSIVDYMMLGLTAIAIFTLAVCMVKSAVAEKEDNQWRRRR